MAALHRASPIIRPRPYVSLAIRNDKSGPFRQDGFFLDSQHRRMNRLGDTISE